MLNTYLKYLTEKINYNPEDLKSHDGIAAVIRNKENKILMFYHNKFKFWTIPVGKAKPNESPEQALKTEVFEECNIRIKKYNLIARKKFTWVRNGKGVDVDMYIYEIVSYSGKIENKEPHKHSEMKFLSINEIKKLQKISDSTKLFLKTEEL